MVYLGRLNKIAAVALLLQQVIAAFLSRHCKISTFCAKKYDLKIATLWFYIKLKLMQSKTTHFVGTRFKNATARFWEDRKGEENPQRWL